MSRVGALLLLVAACGCAPTVRAQHLDALAAGDRAMSAGRAREAVLHYDMAAREAGRARDRDEADYRAAATLARLGERDEALRRFDRVAASSPHFERGPRAAWEAAVLRCDGGNPAEVEAGRRGLEAIVMRWPETGPARLALRRLLREDDQRDASGAAALARVEALLEVPAVVATPLYESLLAERALRLARAGRRDDAVAGWRRLFAAVPYPQNSRWDDGHMALADLLLDAGDPRGAVAALDEMLAVRDSSCAGGSCDAPLFQEGAMRRARILRDSLGDLAAAARAWRHVYEAFPDSRVRDDALYEEAVTRERLGDGGACGVWRRLGVEFPCGRRGREARVRLRACGGALEALPRCD